MKNSFKIFILGLVTMVFLAACGQDTKDIEVKEEENQQGETTQQEEKTQPEEVEKEEETQSKLGSRTNPVPFQKTATVDDELYDDEGNAYAIKMVSESVDIYSGDVYGTTEPDFSFEMYVGGEKEGYISGLVKTGEKAQLRYEEIGSFRMEKKKAIKPVTATAIAASAFGAVTAPPTDAASSSIDKSVKKATDQMRKAYNTYMQAAKSGKLASYSAVKKEIDLAKTYYYAAIKAADKAGKKRGNYRKQLFDNKKLLTYAERYALTVKINLKTPQAGLNAALDSGDVEEIIAARQALKSKLYSYNKSTAQVYGAEARRLLGNQAKSAKAQLISLKDEIAVYNAFKVIERNVVLGQYTKAGLQIDRIEKKLDKVRSKDSTFAKDIVANADRIINRIRGSLTIVGDDQGNKLINGTAKTYTVTLKHPGTGKPIAGAKLNVTFEENLETNFKPQRNVGITDDDNDYVVPYQSTDGKEEEAVIRTDKNGKATFTVTGTNGTVTPIVFLDGSNQEWDTKGGKLPEPQDGRFDEDVEIAAYADSVTFGVTEYKIEVEGKRTNHAAVVDEDRSQINGREYKITVTKPNGDPWVGGEVNVGIDELLDGKLGNNPRGAFLVKDDDVFDEDERYEQLRLKLDGEGQAEFFLASTKVNDSARPVVWIDQNNANGSYDGRLEDGEPVSDRDEVDPTNFQPPYVDSEKLGAKLEVRDGTDADFRYWENHFEEIPDDLEDVKGFKFSLLNQSGNPFLPDSYNDDAKDARVTFEVENTGPNLVKVHTAGFLENSSLKNPVGADDTDISDGVIRIGVGGKVTIAGDIIDWADWFDINSAVIVTYSVGGDSSVDVRASAVVDGLSEDYESRSISVSTDYVSVDLNNRIDEDEDDIIQDVEEKDTDKDGYIDQIILTFDREVHNFEAGDFRLIEGAHDTDYSTAVKVEYGKKDENIVETEKKKLVITVNEFDGFEDSDSKLYYDGNFSGSKELTDEYGTKVRAFVVDEDGAENVD